MAETVPGGRYKVGDTYVSADGKPVAETKDGAKQDGGESTYPHAAILAKGGFKTWKDVVAAKDEDIQALEGIGPARLAEIRAYKG